MEKRIDKALLAKGQSKIIHYQREYEDEIMSHEVSQFTNEQNDIALNSRPLSHTNDPATSFDAADKLIKSGALSKQEKKVLSKIKWYKKGFGYGENFTARELSIIAKLDYHLIQRRLSGLRDKGKIERTGEKRDNGKVWRLI